MARSTSKVRPVAASCLVAAMLVYVGCNAAPDAPAPKAKASAGAGQSGPSKPPETAAASGDFAGWPTPKAVLVVSGEQIGYLEPCGCTKGQLGGLLRRANLVEKLKNDRQWPVALVDLGGLIKDPGTARGGPEQMKIKFGAALKALAALNYDALALSPDDLKLGVDEAVGRFMNMPGDTVKVVAANVSAPGLEARIVPSVRKKAGAVTFGITAVVDPSALKALRDPSLDLLEVKPIDANLPAVLADLEKDTTARVLLVQGPPALAKELAKKYPTVGVIVGKSDSPEPSAEPDLLNGGKTLFVNPGEKGKFVIVIGFFDDPKRPFRYQRVALGSRYDGPAPAMKGIIQDEFRTALKESGIVENFPRHGFVNAPEGATYVGANACKSCHPNTLAKWSTTKHAQAFESLLHDPKPNVIFDAECVSCHTTGFGYNGGWTGPESTAFLKGNQCENCHGPASKHAAAPDDKDFRAALHLTADLADKNGLCIRCHDEDNSPNHFDFAQRWGQVIHKGLDDYKDPRTHQGIAK